MAVLSEAMNGGARFKTDKQLVEMWKGLDGCFTIVASDLVGPVEISKQYCADSPAFELK